LDVPRRALNRNNFAARTDYLSKVQSRVTRPGANIEHARTNGNSRPTPAVENSRPPNLALQAEPS